MICPVCSHNAALYDTVDFNKSCNCALPPRNITVDYYQCSSCDFLFVPSIHAWTAEQFSQHIYNDEYAVVDPEHSLIRPHRTAIDIHTRFGHIKHSLRHLDYGGGRGAMSALLTEKGWNSVSYDPFYNDNIITGTFNLITIHEVIEHVPDAHGLMRFVSSVLEPSGVILIGTQLTDHQIKKPLTWWYAAPRNGHISIHSTKSLTFLANQYGLKITYSRGSEHALQKSC